MLLLRSSKCSTIYNWTYEAGESPSLCARLLKYGEYTKHHSAPAQDASYTAKAGFQSSALVVINCIRMWARYGRASLHKRWQLFRSTTDAEDQQETNQPGKEASSGSTAAPTQRRKIKPHSQGAIRKAPEATSPEAQEAKPAPKPRTKPTKPPAPKPPPKSKYWVGPPGDSTTPTVSLRPVSNAAVCRILGIPD